MSGMKCFTLRWASPPGLPRAGEQLAPRRVGLDPQRRDHGGEHLVVPREHAELDRLALVEVAAQLGPAVVVHVAVAVERLGRCEQRALAIGPARRGRTLGDARQLLVAEAG